MSAMRYLIRPVLKTIVVALMSILILSVTCIGASPAFAQFTLDRDKTTISYIPKQPNLKDEQNIDFLYDFVKIVRELSKDNPELSESLKDVPSETMVSRKAFSEFYYSPAKEAFSLRESMKLARAVSCKVSRVTGVRGIDLAGKGIELINSSLKSNNKEPISDYQMGVGAWKSVYEHFCPNLW